MNHLNAQKIKSYFEALKRRGDSYEIIEAKLAVIYSFLGWLEKKGKITKTEFDELYKVKELIDVEINKYKWHRKSLPDKLSQRFFDDTQRIRNRLYGALSSLKYTSPRVDTTKLGLPHYIAGLLVLIFIGILGAGIYNQFFKKANTPFAFPSTLTRGNRTLSFQGRLTDVVGNPITTQSDVVFKLYNVPSAGTALYTFSCTSSNGVTPDQDGIFSTLIGDDCNQTQFIPDNVFTDYPNVYLGIKIGSDAEMTPRQQIANVGYAMNSETLQGFRPGTDKYNIPYINSQGDLLIATSGAGLRSTWETANLTLSSAKDLLLNSGDPDISGGDIIAQASGSASVIRFKTATTDRLYIDSSANGGNVGIGTTTPSTFKLEAAGSVGPSVTDTYDLGSSSRLWNDVYVDRLCFDGGSDCMTNGAGTTIWTDAGGYVYPTNGEFLGNNNTGGSNKLTGVYLADSSPLYFGTDNDINASFNNTTSTLDITQGNNDVNFDTNTFFIDGSANRVGIGTTAPLTKAHVSTGTLSLGSVNTNADDFLIEGNNNPIGLTIASPDAGSGNIYFADTSANAIGRIVYSHVNNDLQFVTSNSTGLTIDSSQQVGVGTTAPGTRLDVNGYINAGGGTIGTRNGVLNIKEPSGVAPGGTGTGLAIGEASSYKWIQSYDSSPLALNPLANNVGIGDTTPTATLDVTGSIGISDTTVISSGRVLQNIANLGSNLHPSAANTYSIGTGTGNQLLNLYAQNLYQNGNGVCDSTGTNCPSSGVTTWNGIISPTGNQSLTMAAYTTTWGWTSSVGLNALTANLTNSSGSVTTQNLFTLNNAVAGASTDLNTESLLLLQQLDTTSSGTTVLDNALKVDAAANSGITNGIQVTNSAGNVTTGLLLADTGGGTMATGLSMTGTFTNYIDTPNFDVNNAGNITVAAGQGLDTNASGILALGNTTATTVNIGNTAATTLALGAGGSLTRAIDIGTGTGVDTINIGTGGTGADVIAIGSTNAGAVSVRSNAALTLLGSTNSIIDFPNFDVATTGNVTVASGQGIDTPGAGTIALGNVNATTVNLGNTAATTIAIGAGGSATRTFNIGTGTGADTINLGTGASTADDINIGGLSTSTVDVIGTVRAGDGGATNYLQITSGGNLSFVGSASTIDKVSGTLNINTTNNQAITTGTGAFTAGGNLLVNGDTTIGNAITDNITFTGRVAQDADLLPITATGTNDLGSASLQWDNVYAVAFTQNGNAVCDSSGSGCPASTTRWNTLLDPNGNQALTMAAYTSTWGWTSSAGLNALTANLVNNSSVATQNLFTLNNAVTTGTTDVNTESLILLQQLDTTGTGTTVLDNALKIDSAANSGITNGIQVTNSAGNMTTGLLIADTGGGTLATGISLTGTFTDLISATNFAVNNAGNITVAASQGLDTNASGILALGNTTATTVNIGNTAATTIAIGAGGSATRTFNIGTGTGADTINLGTGGSTADDINFGGLSTTTVDVTGTVRAGDGGATNYLQITSGGNLSFVGSANLIDKVSGTLSINTTNNQAITTGTGTFTAGGDFQINGNTTIGNAITDNLTFTARVAQDSDLIPITATGTSDLGTASLQWDNVYAVSFNQNGNLVCDSAGTNCPASTTRWNTLLDPNGNQSLTMGAFTSTWTFNSLTSGTGLTASSTSLADGNLALLSVNSPDAASNNQRVLRITTAGANTNSTQTTYGLHVANTHTGTSSTNVAGYFSASGGSNNYAGIFENGRVGIGTPTPLTPLHITNGDLSFPTVNTAADDFLIEGTSNPIGMTIASPDAGSGNIYFADTSGNAQGRIIYSHVNDDLQFTTDSDGTPTLTMDNSNRVGIGTTAPGAKLDVESTQTSGTISKIGAPSSVTLAGTLTGLNIDLSTNYTATGFSSTGLSMALPANSAATTDVMTGLSMTAGAITNSSGTSTWTGFDVTMPAITQSAGTLTSTGIKITGGTVTSGTSYGLLTDQNAGNVGIGLGTPLQRLSVQQDSVANMFGLYDGDNNNDLLIADGGVVTFKPTAFDNVYTFDGVSTYANNLTESKTIGGTPFTLLAVENPSNDIFYTGLDHKFATIYFDIQQAGAGVTLVKEYWNGSTWTALTVTDNTSAFTTDGTITFTAPSDWATTSVNSVTKYWVRFRSSTQVTTNPTANSVTPTTGSRFNLYAMTGDTVPTLYLNDKGGLGIGTTTPTTFKLEVAGDIGPSADNTYDLGSSGRRWANIYGASVTGTTFTLSGFTAGSVLFAGSSGVVTQDNANFFIDDTNNTFGIGSTRSGAISATNARLLVKGSGATSSTSSFNVTDSANTSILFVRDDGRVGIGNTGPSSELEVTGTVEASIFCDDGNCGTYYLDAGNSGTSLALNGNVTMISGGTITSGGNFSLTTDSGTSTTEIVGGANGGNTTLCVTFDASGAGSCDGKIDTGTVDPPYTINGKKYATYMSSMTGVKEETTGFINTTEYISGVGYRAVINFTQQQDGSDLWLFSKTTNLKNNIDKMVALLSPEQNTRTWYKVDRSNYSLYLYSSKPTRISYRLTAPRFDYEKWANVTPNGSTGFIVNDPDQSVTVALNEYGEVPPTVSVSNENYTYDGTLTGSENYVTSLSYTLTSQTGEIIDEISTASKGVFATVQSGLLTTQNAVVKNLLVAKNITSEKIISPVIETRALKVSEKADISTLNTDTISPKDKNITIDLKPKPENAGTLANLIIKGLKGKTVATVDSAGNAAFAGNLTAQSASLSGTIAAAQGQFNEASIAGTLIAKEIQSETIDNLHGSLSSLSESQTHNNETMEQLSNNVNDIQSLLAELQNQPLSDPQYYQNLGNGTTQQFNNVTMQQLSVSGNSNMYNVAISGSMLAGQIFVNDDSIVSLASDLKLSALNTITLFDGKVTIAKDGTITTVGTLVAQGGIRTNEIRPVTEADDINVILKPKAEGSLGSKLNIKDTLGQEVASVDASGSAYFKNGISVDKYLDATSSGSLISAVQNFELNGILSPAFETGSKTAGIGIVPANETEVVIYNTSVKENTLVYLTPETANLPSQLVVATKQTCSGPENTSACKPYFKVSIDTIIHPEIKFNWLIIN